MNRKIESLVRGYHDQTLSEEEVSKLEELLKADRDAREVFLQETNLIAALEDIACEEQSVSAEGPHRSVARAKLWMASAAGWGVAVAAILFLVFLPFLTTESPVRTIATVTGLSGPLQWTGDGGEVQSDLTLGMELPGGTIDGLSPDSWFSLMFTDGSSVVISGDSMLVFSDFGQKELHLKSGNLSADVATQPEGRPMRVHTRSAVVEVVGTSFELNADVAATAINVTEGEVRVRRLSDGLEVAVPAEHQVVAAADQELKVRQSARTVYSWRSRLESGPDRSYGRWVATEEGGLLYTIPYLTEQRKTIFTAAQQVSSADTMPVSTDDRSKLRVRGRLDRSHSIYVGISLKTSKGEFAGRFQKVLSAENLSGPQHTEDASGQVEFEVSLALHDFGLDPSLKHLAAELPQEPANLIVESVWCHSLYTPVGLAVAEFELTSSNHPTD